jgi:hypothetical protein
MKAKAVLQELFELLESYAPSWYSEEQRLRALAALKQVEKPALRLLQSPAKQRPSSSSAESKIAASRYIQ